MKLRSKYLMSSSVCMISGVVSLFLASCGGGSGGGGAAPNAPAGPNQNQPNNVNQDNTKARVLAFNGFAKDDSYQNNPLKLAGDLSAVEPANLYDYNTFVDNVGTTDKQSNKPAKDYPLVLPASEFNHQTGQTLLDPSLSLKSADPQQIVPSENNPVILTIPAGLQDRPESPFFPANTKYTAVIATSSKTEGATHGPILSLKSGSTPHQFGAFAQDGDYFTLRTYSNQSKVEKALNRDLLSMAPTPVSIQSRYVSLTADGISTDKDVINGNIKLESMDMATFKSLGYTYGSELLAATKQAFPKIYDAKNNNTIFEERYGVFCLGGKNTFNSVSLKHNTYLYPISDITKGTVINSLFIEKDSGIIAESGKNVFVIQLGTSVNSLLNITAVCKDTVINSEDPIVEVGTLTNSVNEINVVINRQNPNFKLPQGGMILLSINNGRLAGTTVKPAAYFYGGNKFTPKAEIKGNSVVLTDLGKPTKISLGSSTALGLLSHDSRTQGISVNAMYELIGALDPMTVVQSHLGGMSSALTQHALNIGAVANNSNHSSVKLNESLNISTGATVKHMVSGIHFSHGFAGIKLSSSAYGIYSVETKDTGFGIALLASKPMVFKSTQLVPSLAIGYDSIAFSGTSLHAHNIDVNVSDALVNSVYARAMTNLSYTSPEGVATTFGFGLEARHGSFSRGLASTDQTSVSMSGEQLNGIYSVAEASFATQSSKVSVSLCNFNQFQLQFGFND